MSTITDPTDKQLLSQALANTYSTHGGTTGWERCQQYQASLEYSGEHPNAGRVRVANNMLDGDEQVPPSRVRPWLNGSMPDPMRGIQAAETHGWLDLSWGSATLQNLTVLLAWIYSGGSINDHWVPYLAVDGDETEQLAHRLLRALKETPETVRDDQQGRATEVRPTTDGPTLGRLLVVFGAPQGEKNAAADISLPPWLADAPRQLRIAFARTYVWNRGTPRDDKPSLPLQIQEERPQAYLDELRDFFAGLTGDRPRGARRALTFTPDAARLLDRPPAIRD